MMGYYTYQQYRESAAALREILGEFQPRVLLVLGSGLGALGDEVEDPIVVRYEDVPHMKYSTAPDHKGQFVFGRLSGQNVAVMQGRLHPYEGWSFVDVGFPVRLLRLLGADTVIVTNAAGAVNTGYQEGDIMMITDHIKLFGVSPLCGPNIEEFGPPFPGPGRGLYPCPAGDCPPDREGSGHHPAGGCLHVLPRTSLRDSGRSARRPDSGR